MLKHSLKILLFVGIALLLVQCGTEPRQSAKSSQSLSSTGLDPFSYLNADQRQQDLWAELMGIDPSSGGDQSTGGNNNNGSTINNVSNASCGNSLACAMTDAINAVRTSNGLASLGVDGACARAAQAHAEDMAAYNYFSHIGRDGSDPVTRAIRYGATSYRISENIAYSSSNIQQTVNLWLNSAGHRANILDPRPSHTGVGAASRGEVVYWVQCFMDK